MRPSKKEEDPKEKGLQPEPLCLFCYPEETSFFGRTTYLNVIPKKEENFRGWEDARAKQREEFWLRKRTEARIRRRRLKEPIRNLRSFLLTSVKYESVPQKTLPSLFEVLETVKDAWSSPPPRNKAFLRDDEKKPSESQDVTTNQPKMKDEPISLKFSSELLNRRLSMPEELMRKYSVSKERTSEESETNKTMIEISSSSSSSSTVEQEETTRRRLPDVETVRVQQRKLDAYQQTSDSEKSEVPKRVTQTDYYSQGKRIIKVKAVEKGRCTCRSEKGSSTTASAKEETDESGTSESLSSSSPTQLPKRESSSGNLSSESEYIRCTCAEMTSSKETSTDLFHSGKSTLSQTVSDKSISTQDSTASINSVSTRGSTATDNSNSTTPEVERTSAKETTTSPDYSPRTPRSNMNRKNRRRDKYHVKTCPKHSRNHLTVGNRQHCAIHSDSDQSKTTVNAATNTEHKTEDSVTQTAKEAKNEVETPAITEKEIKGESNLITQSVEERYKWAKLSQEEVYMMQQLRHRRFVENQRRLSNPLPATPDKDSIGTCGTGSVYKETEAMSQTVMIPRYSALPRTLSMLVNTSSPDTSIHNSDSDNQSLADSLEDQPITHVHKLYFDTKKESKPVRGDVNLAQESKLKHKQPRGRAFFVSIKDPYGEDEMLESIEKIPQPPEKIKNQIFERHLKLCTKHQHLHKSEQKLKSDITQKKRKTRNKNEEMEKTARSKKTNTKESVHDETKKVDRKVTTKKEDEEERTKRTRKEDKKAEKMNKGTEEGKTMTRMKREGKDQKGRSKIPILVSSRSTSSSPERESEVKEKQTRPKIRIRREKVAKAESEELETVREVKQLKTKEVETTQIMEITQTGTELSLQKPQAVIHPSQIPFNGHQKDQLTIPPLASTLRSQPFRQTWNKPLLINPARRSPIGKFRQRFEVIPEEKSSSLSSAEEKNGRESRSKFADASTSPLLEDKPEKIQFQSYNMNEVPNLFVAKITNKQLETLPYVKNNDNQKIILLSSKNQNSNSSKGRDALIAMNREDFNRLAKGWMNFYKLSETVDNSENEENLKSNKNKEAKRQKEKDEKKDKAETNTHNNEKNEQTNVREEQVGSVEQRNNKMERSKSVEGSEVDENLRFHSSNTILRSDTNRTIKRQTSLPELKPPQTNNTSPEHRVAKYLEDDDTDSDSTDYMEPPSPRVPPLPIGDIPSDGTISSGESELDDSKPQVTTQSLKYLQFKRRGANNRSKQKKEHSFETSRFGKKKNPGWSVTVAGTVELSRSAPDLEMRLSFPMNGEPPVVCHSDSGFAEDSNYSKLSESLQDLDFYTSRKELPLGSGNMKQKWMVTVKNPKQGSAPDLSKSFAKNSGYHLPELESSRNRNANKVLKDDHSEEKLKRVVERKMRAIWPKVQRVIQKEFLTESGRLVTEFNSGLDEDFCLLVRGSAVSLERKEKPPTMTERDVTRRYTSRTDN